MDGHSWTYLGPSNALRFDLWVDIVGCNLCLKYDFLYYYFCGMKFCVIYLYYNISVNRKITYIKVFGTY